MKFNIKIAAYTFFGIFILLAVLFIFGLNIFHNFIFWEWTDWFITDWELTSLFLRIAFFVAMLFAFIFGYASEN